MDRIKRGDAIICALMWVMLLFFVFYVVPLMFDAG